LQLVDEISPLVSIVFLIFRKIGPFMIIWGIVVIALSAAFWMIGRNQVEFDAIPVPFDDETHIKQPFYHDIKGSLEFTYYLSLGEFGFIEDFSMGKDGINS
jgi:hypothetical protein